MSMIRTRAQYVCIDAKASSSSVIVYGPVDVVADVKHNLKHDRLNFVDVSLGTTARMSVSGCETGPSRSRAGPGTIFRSGQTGPIVSKSK